MNFCIELELLKPMVVNLKSSTMKAQVDDSLNP